MEQVQCFECILYALFVLLKSCCSLASTQQHCILRCLKASFTQSLKHKFIFLIATSMNQYTTGNTEHCFTEVVYEKSNSSIEIESSNFIES